MKNLLKFSLFESVGFNYTDLKIKKNYDEHIEFAFKGMAEYNEDHDFVRWCIFKAYSVIILEMELPQSSIDYINSQSNLPYPNGFKSSFDFDKEIENDSSLGFKSLNWFIKNFLVEEIRRISSNKSISLETKKAFISAVDKSINNAAGDIFLPGNLQNIQKLKYLDYIYKYSKNPVEIGNLGIDKTVTNYIDSSFYKFISLYPEGSDRDQIVGEKVLSLLKIFSHHNMEYFKTIKLPDLMADYVVKYFNMDKESFKTADDLRKSNIGIYNKIKDLLPDIDTAADLGDLGF